MRTSSHPPRRARPVTAPSAQPAVPRRFPSHRGPTLGSETASSLVIAGAGTVSIPVSPTSRSKPRWVHARCSWRDWRSMDVFEPAISSRVAALHVAYCVATSDGSEIATNEILEEILLSHGSAWKVGTREGHPGLERRVPLGVQEAAEHVMANSSHAGDTSSRRRGTRRSA